MGLVVLIILLEENQVLWVDEWLSRIKVQRCFEINGHIFRRVFNGSDGTINQALPRIRAIWNMGIESAEVDIKISSRVVDIKGFVNAELVSWCGKETRGDVVLDSGAISCDVDIAVGCIRMRKSGKLGDEGLHGVLPTLCKLGIFLDPCVSLAKSRSGGDVVNVISDMARDTVSCISIVLIIFHKVPSPSDMATWY